MRVIFQICNDKLSFNDVNYEVDLPIIPRIKEEVAIIDFLSDEDYKKIEDTSDCWSGDYGRVLDVILRKDKNGWYYLLWVHCEDS